MNIFYTDLLQQLEPTEQLLNLATKTPWQNFHDEFKVHYKECDAPGKPIRFLVGLLILKQMHDVGGETVVEQ